MDIQYALILSNRRNFRDLDLYKDFLHKIQLKNQSLTQAILPYHLITLLLMVILIRLLDVQEVLSNIHSIFT